MKKYLFFAAALFTLAACNNDENLPADDPNAPVEIRLSSSIAVQTRAAHDLDKALKADEEVHVWVDDAGNSGELYDNNIFKAEANGALTLTKGKAMYFPSTGNDVNIYAIHGNFGTDTDWENFWGTGITHTVSQKQQSGESEKGEGYAVSDLVYAQRTDVARTDRNSENKIGLQFKHLLSKIEVVLVQGNGLPSIGTVEILNTKLQAKFTPSKTPDWEVSAEGGVTDNNPILIDNDLTSDVDAKGTDENKKILNEAIIVPQTLGDETPFIRITTDEGGVLVYALDKETMFEPGIKYRYTITANLTGLTVTATIDDWGPTEDKTGDAEMQ